MTTIAELLLLAIRESIDFGCGVGVSGGWMEVIAWPASADVPDGNSLFTIGCCEFPCLSSLRGWVDWRCSRSRFFRNAFTVAAHGGGILGDGGGAGPLALSGKGSFMSESQKSKSGNSGLGGGMGGGGGGEGAGTNGGGDGFGGGGGGGGGCGGRGDGWGGSGMHSLQVAHDGLSHSTCTRIPRSILQSGLHTSTERLSSSFPVSEKRHLTPQPMYLWHSASSACWHRVSRPTQYGPTLEPAAKRDEGLRGILGVRLYTLLEGGLVSSVQRDFS